MGTCLGRDEMIEKLGRKDKLCKTEEWEAGIEDKEGGRDAMKQIRKKEREE